MVKILRVKITRQGQLVLRVVSSSYEGRKDGKDVWGWNGSKKTLRGAVKLYGVYQGNTLVEPEEFFE